MKQLRLANNEFTQVDNSVFEALSQFNWRRDGTKTNAVICTSRIKGERRLHRILTGAPKGQVVDHIDGDVLNNQLSNLRVCSSKENARNRKKNGHSGNPYKGVNWHAQTKKWGAVIRVDSKLKRLGLFNSPEEAAKAYNQAAVSNFGVYARINQL